MIISINTDKGIVIPIQNAFERLCLQRAVWGSRIIYAPSKDQIRSDVMESRAVTLERLEETDFFTGLEMRIMMFLESIPNIWGRHLRNSS